MTTELFLINVVHIFGSFGLSTKEPKQSCVVRCMSCVLVVCRQPPKIHIWYEYALVCPVMHIKYLVILPYSFNVYKDV